jgi:hypothetical protein
MEIAMHSLMQAAIPTGAFGLWELKPLSQMRSANKKHGNIGDIELLDGKDIVESWDAKYGKAYLRDEIEEVIEKIEYHAAVQVLGFVTTEVPIKSDEIDKKIADYTELYGFSIQIMTLDNWISYIFNKVVAGNFTFSNDTQLFNWLLRLKNGTISLNQTVIDWITDNQNFYSIASTQWILDSTDKLGVGSWVWNLKSAR